jgi:hypothetical protein
LATGLELWDEFVAEAGRGFTGEQGGAGSRADGSSCVCVGELHALLGKPVQVRSAVLFVASAAKVTPSKIVREED